MKLRCNQNRKRTKRRAVYCLVHNCHLDSVSQKYSLFADCSEQLQQRGVGRKNALLLLKHQSTVSLDKEWLEAFWCRECQETKWYHVQKTGDRSYELAIAPVELWRQVQGVADPRGNPSVGEFTRRQARMVGCNGLKDFGFIN